MLPHNPFSFSAYLRGRVIHRVGIAVSGGPDSMLLAHTIASWARKVGVEGRIFIVDHGLRPHGLYEANIVARWVARLFSLPVTLLKWDAPPKVVSMNLARQHRYALLLEACRTYGIKYLCLGHHLTDQIETFYMRYEKGSGLQGLAGMPFLQPMEGINLLRPLLNMTREHVLERVKQLQLPHINEPTNKNFSYTRNAFRHVYASVLRDPAFIKDFIVSQQRIRQTVIAVNQAISDFMSKCVLFHPLGFLKVNLAVFFKHPLAVQRLILKRLLQGLAGFHHLKEARLQHACQMLRLQKKHTLSGCILLMKQGWLMVIREPRALPGPERLLSRQSFLWDNRFFIDPRVDLDVYSDVTVRPLGKAGAKHFKDLKHALRNIPAYVLQSLPAIWQSNRLLSIPPLDGNSGPIALECTFTPRVFEEKLYMEF